MALTNTEYLKARQIIRHFFEGKEIHEFDELDDLRVDLEDALRTNTEEYILMADELALMRMELSKIEKDYGIHSPVEVIQRHDKLAGLIAELQFKMSMYLADSE